MSRQAATLNTNFILRQKKRGPGKPYPLTSPGQFSLYYFLHPTKKAGEQADPLPTPWPPAKPYPSSLLPLFNPLLQPDALLKLITSICHQKTEARGLAGRDIGSEERPGLARSGRLSYHSPSCLCRLPPSASPVVSWVF